MHFRRQPQDSVGSQLVVHVGELDRRELPILIDVVGVDHEMGLAELTSDGQVVPRVGRPVPPHRSQ